MCRFVLLITADGSLGAERRPQNAPAGAENRVLYGIYVKAHSKEHMLLSNRHVATVARHDSEEEKSTQFF